MMYINHNRLLNEMEGCIGVKTGYTKAAGRSFVGAAEQNGVTLIDDEHVKIINDKRKQEKAKK